MPLLSRVREDRIFEIEELAAVDLTSLMMRLRTLFFDPSWRPPLPPTAALEVMRLSKSPQADPKKIAAVFASEPLLAAQVHKSAQAPIYGAGQINSIEDAIVRLGLKKLHDVVLEASMQMRVFKSAEFAPWMDRIRRHSVAVAHIARAIARPLDVDPDAAFFVGLIHDIGCAAVLAAVGERSNRAAFAGIDATSIAAAMDEIHVEVGALITSAWKLPGRASHVVAAHHHVPGNIAEPRLAAVLVLAEALAIDAGFDISAPNGPAMDPIVPDDLAWARAELGLDDAGLGRLSAMLTPMLALLKAG